MKTLQRGDQTDGQNPAKALFALQPVTFRYKQEIDPYRKLSFGLIAEDVAEVSADLVTRDAEGNPRSVRYDAVNAMLLNEFIKEHRKVEEQQAAISRLNSTVAAEQTLAAEQQKELKSLVATVKEQAAKIEKVNAQLKVNGPAARLVLHGP
jgi:superfamily I DNA and RNA helicase